MLLILVYQSLLRWVFLVLCFLAQSSSELMPWCGVSQLFPLNNFFSRTTEPNSTKLGRKCHWEMWIQIC